jgi:hypothetical protein
VVGACKKYKLFERKYSASVNNTKATSATPSKPHFKPDSSTSARNFAEKRLAEEMTRFNASIEQNKPISAAWCTGLISQATELSTISRQ